MHLEYGPMHLEYGPMHLEYGHLEYAQEVSGCTGSRTAYRSIARGEKKVRANYWLKGCDIQSHGFLYVLHYFLVVILNWLQAVQYCTAYTCNNAHISYVHILSAYVVCIFCLLFGVLATLALFRILSVS